MSKQTWRSPDLRYAITRQDHDELYWQFTIFDQIRDQTKSDIVAAYGYIQPHYDDKRIEEIWLYQEWLERQYQKVTA